VAEKEEKDQRKKCAESVIEDMKRVIREVFSKLQHGRSVPNMN